MMRSYHKLRGYNKRYIPRHIIFVDTETTTIKPDEDVHYPSLILGVAQYVLLDERGRENGYSECVFRTVGEFWSYVDTIAKSTTDLTLFAHNWSFDFPILSGFRYLRDYGWRIKSIVEQSPPIIIRYTRKGDKLTIVDSLNFFRESLKSMGESVGQNKIEINFDTCSDSELSRYCSGDVDILRKSIVSLIQFVCDTGIGRLTNTVASLAMHSFTTQYMHHDIYVDANERRVAVARASYFGGRTECFRLGRYKGKFRLIDVNSMYPHVMIRNNYPTKPIAHYKRVCVADLDKLLYRYCITAECVIDTDIPVYPVKIEGRTCFPVGRYTTYLSTPEIEYGLNHNLITDVLQIVVYEMAPIFESYVESYYNARLEYRSKGNEMYQQFAKMLMNSLYGKFGQTGHEWEPTNLEAEGVQRKWEEYDNTLKQRISYMEIDDIVYECVSKPESRNSIPSIAAHVTAYARILLQNTIDHIGRDHCYYTDTDSLLIDDYGFKRIRKWLDPKRLGCWSLDGEYDEIDIRGPKDYKFGAKERIKGIKPNHVITDMGLYRQIQFTSLRWNIRENIPDAPAIRHVEKNLRRLYKKGNVLPSGIVEPYRLGV